MKLQILFALILISVIYQNIDSKFALSYQSRERIASFNINITTIRAEKGLEWRKEERCFIARGNVQVHRGHVTLSTDVLVIFTTNRKYPDKFAWWQAAGNTRIVFPMGTLSGEMADYDMHEKIFSLSGPSVHLETSTETLTAHKNIEYHEEQQVAVLHGNAHVVARDGTIVKAKIAIVHLQMDSEITKKKIFLIGEKIRLETQNAIFCGKRGIYSFDTGIAIFIHSAQGTPGRMRMTGKRVVMNTTTGLSRLYTTLPIKKKLLKIKKEERIKLLFSKKI